MMNPLARDFFLFLTLFYVSCALCWLAWSISGWLERHLDD